MSFPVQSCDIKKRIVFKRISPIFPYSIHSNKYKNNRFKDLINVKAHNIVRQRKMVFSEIAVLTSSTSFLSVSLLFISHQMFATFYDSAFLLSYFVVRHILLTHAVLSSTLLPPSSSSSLLLLSSINFGMNFPRISSRSTYNNNNTNNYKTCFVLHSIFTLLREFPFIWLKLYLFIYLPAHESWTTVFSPYFQCAFIGVYVYVINAITRNEALLSHVLYLNFDKFIFRTRFPFRSTLKRKCIQSRSTSTLQLKRRMENHANPFLRANPDRMWLVFVPVALFTAHTTVCRNPI